MMSGLLPPRSSKGPRAVSHPTCRSVSFDRCDRRDLLVGLEGDERGSHARCSGTRCCVVQPVGWAPGLRAESHKATGAWSWRSSTRPGPGSRQGSGGTIRRWICRETTCQTVTFLEHDERVCAPRARLGVRAIRWAIRQLRFEGATIAGLARQLATTWNTVWSHIKPCLQAASDDPARFAGVQVLGVDERRVASPGLTPPGPRELTGIVDLTRGKDHPTARLLDLVPGRSGTVYKNWLAERGEDFRAGVRIATLDPLPGTARTPLTTRTKTQPACSTPFVWSSSPATPQVRCVAASSKTPWVTAHAQAIPSTQVRNPLRASHTQAHPTSTRTPP